MQVETFVLGDLQTNCYLLHHDQEAVIIDPADDGDFLNEELSRRNLKLVAVVLTHGHFDHCLGLLSLKLAWPDLKIYLHPADNFLLEKAVDHAQFWLHRQVDPVPMANCELRDGQKLDLLGETFTIIHTPGHTPGCICLLSEKQADDEIYLFSGDTSFKNGIGRTDFSYSDHFKMKTSLAKLKKMKQDDQYSLALPGHGESFY